MLPNGPDIVAALFGIWFAGGVYVPLNPRLSADELAHVIAEDRPAAILTTPDDAGADRRRPGRARDRRRHLGRAGPLDADAPPSPAGVAAISFTSGTTGRPEAGAARARQRARPHRRRARHAARRDGADRRDAAPKRADAEPDPDVAVAVGRHLQRDLRVPGRRGRDHHGPLRHRRRSPASSSASSCVPPCCRRRR